MIRQFARKVLNRVRGPEAPVPAGAPARPAAETEPAAQAETLTRIDSDAQEVKERVEAGEPVVLVDVREPAETALGIIRGARLIPLSQLEARWEEVKDCNEIICYCAMGRRSEQAARFLRGKGLFTATSLSGGVQSWTGMGGELIPPAG